MHNWESSAVDAFGVKRVVEITKGLVLVEKIIKIVLRAHCDIKRSGKKD